MNNIAMWIAIYGAILSSVTLTWNIISYLTDKPKIVPEYSTGLIPMLGEKNQYIFSITFSNPTKHRVVINSAGILFKNHMILHLVGGKQVLPIELPKVLLQGDSYAIHKDIDDIKKAIDKQGKPAYVWVRDATGKTYKGSVKYMIENVNAMYKVKHKKITKNNLE